MNALTKVVAVMAVILAAGCDSRLSWDECMRNVDCKNATDVAVRANETIHVVCPTNSNATTPACDAAMSTLDAAEASAFAKLTHNDAVTFSQSLMATR